MPARLAFLTSAALALWYRRPSVGKAIAFSCTVVSIFTTASEGAETVLVVIPTWIVRPSMNSHPASPIRFRNRVIIRQMVSVLQIVQSDHQPNRDARLPFFRVKIAELLFGCVPVNLAGQFVQRVTLIQYLIQPQLEQVISESLLDFTWFHFARNPYSTDRILVNSTSLEHPSKQINSSFLWVVQGRLM